MACRNDVLSGLLFFFTSVIAFPQTIPSIPWLPRTLTWQNTPRSWHMDKANVLTISAEAKTDWFVDPFDGTVAKNAPILLFTPDSDYVFGARVALKFITKWDAGALMLWGDDHHWANLLRVVAGEEAHTRYGGHTRPLGRLQFQRSARRFRRSAACEKRHDLCFLLFDTRRRLANSSHV